MGIDQITKTEQKILLLVIGLIFFFRMLVLKYNYDVKVMQFKAYERWLQANRDIGTGSDRLMQVCTY